MADRDDYDEEEYGEEYDDGEEYGEEGEEEEENYEDWVIEQILKHKKDKEATSYLVKWVGFDQPSWMIKDTLVTIDQKKVKEYDAKVAAELEARKKAEADAKEKKFASIPGTKNKYPKRIVRGNPVPHAVYHAPAVPHEEEYGIPFREQLQLDYYIIDPEPENPGTNVAETDPASLVASPATPKRSGGGSGRVGSLRKLALDCLAENLLLFESMAELPIQYRSPIFLTLLRKQMLTGDHLSLLLGPDQKTIDCSGFSTNISNEIIMEIGHICVNLTTLNIANAVQVTEQCLNHISRKCSRLSTLDISGLPGLVGATCLDKFRSLKVLRMARCTYLAEGLEWMVSPLGCLQLEEFDISGCTSLRSLPAQLFKALRHLRIFKAAKAKVDGGRICTFLPPECTLEYLDITDCAWIHPDMVGWMLASSANTLQTLIMDRHSTRLGEHVTFEMGALSVLSAVGAVEFKLSALTHMPALTDLDISAADCRTDHLQDLFAGVYRCRLKKFKWNYWKITDHRHWGLDPFFQLLRSRSHDLEEVTFSLSDTINKLLNASYDNREYQAIRLRTIVPSLLDWNLVKFAMQPRLTTLDLSESAWLEGHHLKPIFSVVRSNQRYIASRHIFVGKMPNLVSLNVSNCIKLNDVSLRNCLNLLPKLQTYIVGGWTVDGFTFESVVHTNLHTLIIRHGNMTDTGMISIFTNFPNLKKISIKGCGNLSPWFVQETGRFSIREISLDCPDIKRLDYITLMKAAIWARLPRLNISECMLLIGDVAIPKKTGDKPGCRVSVKPCMCSKYDGFNPAVARDQMNFVV